MGGQKELEGVIDTPFISFAFSQKVAKWEIFFRFYPKKTPFSPCNLVLFVL